MVEAAAILGKDRPGLRFVTTAVNEKLAARLRELAAVAHVTIEVSQGDIHRLMQTCGCAVIASGTATLEAAFFGLPYCLVYKVAWLTATIARLVMKVDYLGIVNNLAGRAVVEELLQERATGPSIAAALAAFLDSPAKRESLTGELTQVAASLRIRRRSRLCGGDCGPPRQRIPKTLNREKRKREPALVPPPHEHHQQGSLSKFFQHFLQAGGAFGGY